MSEMRFWEMVTLPFAVNPSISYLIEKASGIYMRGRWGPTLFFGWGPLRAYMRRGSVAVLRYIRRIPTSLKKFLAEMPLGADPVTGGWGLMFFLLNPHAPNGSRRLPAAIVCVCQHAVVPVGPWYRWCLYPHE